MNDSPSKSDIVTIQYAFWSRHGQNMRWPEKKNQDAVLVYQNL